MGYIDTRECTEEASVTVSKLASDSLSIEQLLRIVAVSRDVVSSIVRGAVAGAGGLFVIFGVKTLT